VISPGEPISLFLLIMRTLLEARGCWSIDKVHYHTGTVQPIRMILQDPNCLFLNAHMNFGKYVQSGLSLSISNRPKMSPAVLLKVRLTFSNIMSRWRHHDGAKRRCKNLLLIPR
jgi:hypothetical protein